MYQYLYIFFYILKNVRIAMYYLYFYIKKAIHLCILYIHRINRTSLLVFIHFDCSSITSSFYFSILFRPTLEAR